MALKDALKSLNEAVKDLTSLHVQTYTGELNVDIENEDGDKKGFSDIRSEIQQNKQNGTITLVAESLAQFDGDSYNFVKKDLSDVPSTALDVHKNAVKAGIETRMGLLNLFKDLID